MSDSQQHATETGAAAVTFGEPALPRSAQLDGQMEGIDLSPDGQQLKLRFNTRKTLVNVAGLWALALGFVVLGVVCVPLVKPGDRWMAWVPVGIGVLVAAASLMNVPLLKGPLCVVDRKAGQLCFRLNGSAKPAAEDLRRIRGVVVMDVTLIKRKVGAGERAAAAGAMLLGAQLQTIDLDPARKLPHHLYLVTDYGTSLRLGTSRDRQLIVDVGTKIGALLGLPLEEQKGEVER